MSLIQPLGRLGLLLLLWSSSGIARSQAAEPADVLLRNGKIVTVDASFRLAQAIAWRGERIVFVGSDAQAKAWRGPQTTVVDLQGRMVLPGLIDSHVHPLGAAMYEWDHPIPAFERIDDVLRYIRQRTQVVPEGQWITLRQVFITRLREQRYPTKAELDAAAPKHPVAFMTGPDASVNSLALKLSGIDRNFQVRDGGAGYAEKDAQTGEPTGILRNCSRYLKISGAAAKSPTDADRERRLRQLLVDYNAVGLTGIIDRNADATSLRIYQSLLDRKELTVRVAVSHGVVSNGTPESLRAAVRKIAEHPLRQGGPMLRIIGVKTFLDGGMLTGSAYMRKPWGVSAIYSITDPDYRGLLFIPSERLLPLVEETVKAGLQFTAHSVGDGAVHTLLNAYDEVNRKFPIRATRPCLTHANFMSAEAIAQCARLGVVADIQPAWLYLDTHTLRAQFGEERLRHFQPLRSLLAANVIVGGGSDHMQRIDALASINPYHPFLGMQTAITRRPRLGDQPLHPEEALSREQAIRFYTSNNAYLMFLETQIGSLEVGKRADLIVIDRDLLTCPADTIRDTQVLRTYVDGRLVFERRLRY